MSKFFLFRRENITKNSTYSSDTGVGVSSMAIPASNMAFISSKKGKVFIYFNNAGIYEENQLDSGFSMEKVRVELSCTEGSELEFIESILKFIASGRDDKPIMKFDHVSGYKSFSDAEVGDLTSLNIVTPSSAVERISEGSAKGVKASPPPGGTVLAGINFGTMEYYPLVDYNPSGIADNGTNITKWDNSGIGGSDYDLSPGNLQIIPLATGTTRATTGVNASKSANLSTTVFFDVDNAFRVQNGYTMYFVFGLQETNTESHLGEIFGSVDGTCIGPCRYIDKSYFLMRHYGLEGEVAKTDITGSDDTVGFDFPDLNNEVSERQTCYVFVIRRDADYNIYMHAHTGDVVAELPSVIGGTVSTPYRTDKDLLIEQIGAASSNKTDSFAGYMARFGVIDSDIGPNTASKLAVNLYQLYNPLV